MLQRALITDWKPGFMTKLANVGTKFEKYWYIKYIMNNID